MTNWKKKLLPSREELLANRWLQWLGPRLLNPALWRMSRRGVAMGAALGVFFGFLVPIAQIPLAAGSAALLRGNIPVAAGATLITNPLTLAPFWITAHRIGCVTLDVPCGEPPAPPDLSAPASDVSVLDRWGKPLVAGLVIMAVVGGLGTWVLIMILWRLRTAWQWRRRRRGPNAAPRE